MMEKLVNRSDDYYKNDLLLIYPTISLMCSYHIGASYIIAYLQKKGYRAIHYIKDGQFSCDEIINDILNIDPSCIGFSIDDSNYDIVKVITDRIMKVDEKDRLIIVGGPTSTFSSKKVLQFNPNINICVHYDGEITTKEILDCRIQKRSYSNIKGITFREKNGSIISTPERKLQNNLDEFPSPYLSGVIDVNCFVNEFDLIPIFTARGCSHSCNFCNASTMGKNEVRQYSIDRVIDEIKFVIHQLHYNYNRFKLELMDDNLVQNKKRTMELCHRLQEIEQLEFGIETRIDCMDEDILHELYKAGCKRVNYGMESGVPRILKKMGKLSHKNNNRKDDDYILEKKYLEKMKTIIKISQAIGFEVTANIILGTYTETAEEGIISLSLLKELGVNIISRTIMVYYPGTKSYKDIEHLVKKKIKQIESKGSPVFNFNYKRFPELYEYDPGAIEFDSKNNLLNTYNSDAIRKINKKFFLKSLY